MNRTRLAQGILGLAAVLALSACGHTLPEIQPEHLQKKLSALVITGTDLSAQQKTAIESALHGWNGFQITYEWVRDINGFQPDLEQTIESRPYDYIITAGKSLTAGALAEADKLKQTKWIVLQNGNEAPLPEGNTNVMSKSLDAGAVSQNRQQWVRTQLEGNHQIDWVTTSSMPVPAQWSPSEGEDHTVKTDLKSDWFRQLTLNVRAHHSSWIVIYSPLDAVSRQEINSLRIPVMDMSVTPAGEVQWARVLQSVPKMVQAKLWHSGTEPYTPEEYLFK